MRTIYKYIPLLVAVLSIVACVEPFEPELPASETSVLVVEGSIIDGQKNSFLLTRSVGLNDSINRRSYDYISYANVRIVGSDGEEWIAQPQGSGLYVVADSVALDDNVFYSLVIDYDGNTYCSDPALPQPTPSIDKLEFGLSEGKDQVQVYITSQLSSDSDISYYAWTFEECWEINTPFHECFEYFPMNNSVSTVSQDLSHGFCMDTPIPVIGSNESFGDSILANYMLYSYSNLSNRFNTQYGVRVTQRAISKAEYEYERLLQRQSYEMGGLFTPQPSAFPTNIHCTTDPSLRAIGYVGVSAGVTRKELYISKSDVGYTLQKKIEEKTQEQIEEEHLSYYSLYRLGFRVYEYEWFFNQPPRWCKRWCVDCRDPYWNAVYDTPPYWWKPYGEYYF